MNTLRKSIASFNKADESQQELEHRLIVAFKALALMVLILSMIGAGALAYFVAKLAAK